MKTKINRPIVSIFIDNIKIIRVKKSRITKKVKREFINAFLIVDIRLISFYPDLKVEQNCKQKTIKLSQLAYINKILQKFHLNLINLTNMSIKKEIILLPNASAQTLLSKLKKY